MFCVKCKKELPDGAVFCPWCGRRQIPVRARRRRPLVIVLVVLTLLLAAAEATCVLLLQKKKGLHWLKYLY